MAIKSGLLVYMATYPCLITDFDHKLLGREFWRRSVAGWRGGERWGRGSERPVSVLRQ